MKSDVVIVGSGLGGLLCGAILAKAGLKVTVLEQSNQIGGCIQSYKRSGLEFDTGLHYIGGLEEGQSLHKAFSQLGLLDLPWKKMDDCFDLIQFGRTRYRLMQSWDNFVAELSKDFPHQSEALLRYRDRMHHITPEDMDVNAWDYLHETFSDETLINVLSASSMKMELRKESFPLFNFAHAQNSYIDSSWRLKGSGDLIIDHLCEIIKNTDGQVLTHSKVVAFVQEDTKVSKTVLADGREFTSDYVVTDIHPQLLSALLGEKSARTKRFIKRNSQAENTFGMFTVSLVLKQGQLPYQNHNIFVYEKPNVWDFYLSGEHVSGVMLSYRIPEDDSEYALQMDLLTPMLWDECAEWSDTVVGHRTDAYRAMCKKKAAECITLAETAVPGLSANIEKVYTSTPLTYRDYLSSPEGNAFGTRKDCRCSMLTFGTVNSPLENLFMTGQSITLAGIEGVTMTAYETCRHIVGTVPFPKTLSSAGQASKPTTPSSTPETR